MVFDYCGFNFHFLFQGFKDFFESIQLAHPRVCVSNGCPKGSQTNREWAAGFCYFIESLESLKTRGLVSLFFFVCLSLYYNYNNNN